MSHGNQTGYHETGVLRSSRGISTDRERLGDRGHVLLCDGDTGYSVRCRGVDPTQRNAGRESSGKGAELRAADRDPVVLSDDIRSGFKADGCRLRRAKVCKTRDILIQYSMII